MGSKGGFIRRLRTTRRSHLGTSPCCTGRSMAKFLTRMLWSRSWEISIPLARKTLDMQDIYPWIEDIASFFSSNRKMRKSANCWTVALTGLICLTWHHCPESLDNLQAWRLRFHGCGWKWCEKVCLSSFCTGGRVIGKSIARSNRSGNHSWSYQDDLYVFCSDLV